MQKNARRLMRLILVEKGKISYRYVIVILLHSKRIDHCCNNNAFKNELKYENGKR